jgi:Phytanoyl-CoA dioxygenase (PhyH)
MARMSSRERYLLDLQGWLVIPGVLSEGEVAAINTALDANVERRVDDGDHTGESTTLVAEHHRRAFRGMLEWPAPWCGPFRDLIARADLVPYLDEVLGRGWHLDHHPEVLDCLPGTDGQVIHFGQHFMQAGAWYVWRAGAMRSGMVVVEYLLADQPEGRGGFCAIPGSHKANFPRPHEITLWHQDQDIVRNPGAKAGDVILFTEALGHGSLPWRNDHDRRVGVYRYAAKTVQYAGGFHQVVMPDWVDELPAAQRAALEPARFYDKPIIEPDLSVSQPWDDYDPPPPALS